MIGRDIVFVREAGSGCQPQRYIVGIARRAHPETVSMHIRGVEAVRNIDVTTIRAGGVFRGQVVPEPNSATLALMAMLGILRFTRRPRAER